MSGVRNEVYLIWNFQPGPTTGGMRRGNQCEKCDRSGVFNKALCSMWGEINGRNVTGLVFTTRFTTRPHNWWNGKGKSM